MDQVARARLFRQMHLGPEILVIANAWDAASARVFENAGIRAVGTGSAGIASKPGYPTVIVPWAMVPNAPTTAFPESFKAMPQPFGVSFTGMACSEPTLLKLAYAFEQATKKRVSPPSTP